MIDLERQAVAILRGALDLDGAAQEDYVARECAGSATLLARVRTLMARLEPPPSPTPSAPAGSTASGPGAVLSQRFRLTSRIGEGGMGEVWLAERVDGEFEQQVAVKLLHAGLGALATRFRRERQILARLTHANIAHLVDGGVGDDGRPWLAMEFVDGVPIGQWCEQQRLSLADRVRLLLGVCEAVQFAHRNLVVHRDIKPGNLLVTAQGVPKLLDFGIAKLLDDTDPTQTATLAMTPGYAAPEQRRGDAATTSTDIYQLGLVLFELLCGVPAHVERRRLAATRSGAVARPDPSRAFLALPRVGPGSRIEMAAARSTVPERLVAVLSSDLGRIVDRATAEAPEERYGTASELADDLQRWLDQRPVRAHRGSAGYRLRKFLARHRAAVALGAVAVLAAVAGVAGVLWQTNTALREAARANAVQTFLLDVFRANSSNQADPARARETTARELLDLGVQRIGDSLQETPATRLEVMKVLSGLYRDLDVGEEALRLRREVVVLTRSVHGPDSMAMADALLDLADSLQTSAHAEETDQVLAQAATILDAHPRAPVQSRARLLMRRIEQFNSTDPSRAIVLADQLLELLAPLPATQQLAEAHYVKGMAHHFSGQHAQAHQAFAAAVAVSVQVSGSPNPALPRLYSMLADSQYRMLDVEAALRSARNAQEAARLVHGPDHVDTLQTTMRLGRLLFDTGSTHEGLAQLAMARQLALDTRGPEDAFHTPQTRVEYGFSLILFGDAAGALRELEAAIDNRRRHRPGTLYLAQMQELAARALIDLQQGDEAEALLDEAALIRVQGNQDPSAGPWFAHYRQRAQLAALRGQPDQVRTWLGRMESIAASSASASMVRIEGHVANAELRLAIDDAAGAVAETEQALAALDLVAQRAALPLQRGRVLAVRGQLALRRGDRVAGCADLHAAIALLKPRLPPESPALAPAVAGDVSCRET